MSKLAEKKALEIYPIDPNEYDEDISRKKNQQYFYSKGYDRCLKDIEEFFHDRFNIHPHDSHVVQYESDIPLESIDDLIEQFKNYIQNESEN